MQAIADFLTTLCALCVIAGVILLVIYLIKLITRSESKKQIGKITKITWIAVVILAVVAALFRPSTWCDHEFEVIEEKKVTCTEDGYVVRHCPLCDYEETEKDKSTGHQMHEVLRAEASLESDGKIVEECSVCGFEHTTVIPKLQPTETTSPEKETTLPQSETTEPTEAHSPAIDFAVIYKEYKENELRADDIYKNNRYCITATVNGISAGGLLNMTGGATLTMQCRVGNTIVFFYAEFEKDQEEALKAINVGDTITFEGECLSAGSWVDCELVID